MKKLITAISVCMLCNMTWAYFPTNISSKTVEVAKVTGSFDSYQFKWLGMDDQEVRLTFSNVPVFAFGVSDLVASRISKNGTVYVDILPTNNHPTVGGNFLYYNISRTNLPPNGNYQMETWLYDGANTNASRTIAQGEVVISKSLYQDTNMFPFPAQITNMADYLTILAAAATYATKTQVVLSATMTQGTSNYVTFVGGAGLAIGVRTNYADTSVNPTLSQVLSNGATMSGQTINATGGGILNVATLTASGFHASTATVSSLVLDGDTVTAIATNGSFASDPTFVATTRHVAEQLTNALTAAVVSNAANFYNKTYVDSIVTASTNTASWAQFPASQMPNMDGLRIADVAPGIDGFDVVNVNQMNVSNAAQDAITATVQASNVTALAAVSVITVSDALQNLRITSNEVTLAAVGVTNAAQTAGLNAAHATNAAQATSIQAAHTTNATQAAYLVALGTTNTTQNARIGSNETVQAALTSTSATHTAQIVGLNITNGIFYTNIVNLSATSATHSARIGSNEVNIASLMAPTNITSLVAIGITNDNQWTAIANLSATSATHTAQIAGLNTTNALAITNLVNAGTTGLVGRIYGTGHTWSVVFPQAPTVFGGDTNNVLGTNFWTSAVNSNWYSFSLGTAQGQTLQFYFCEEGNDPWDQDYDDYTDYLVRTGTNIINYAYTLLPSNLKDADNYELRVRSIDQVPAHTVGPNTWASITVPALGIETQSRNVITKARVDFRYVFGGPSPAGNYTLWIGYMKITLEGTLTP